VKRQENFEYYAVRYVSRKLGKRPLTPGKVLGTGPSRLLILQNYSDAFRASPFVPIAFSRRVSCKDEL
jgi:hypothetical protein